MKDKIILITGGDSGIGAATARLFAKQGARVIINFRTRKEEAEKLAEEIAGVAIKADVSRKEEVQAMVSTVLEIFGGIDVVVNNACPAPSRRSMEGQAWEDYDLFMQVVVQGAHQVIQASLPSLKERQGAIINVLSVYVDKCPPQFGPYVVAKQALKGYSESLAAEVGKFGIRVNMVSPNTIKTRMTENLPEKMFEMIAHQTSLKRLVRVEDVAETILFLSKDNCLTGVNIVFGK
jgi:3-oxoacyl-[acyl-carrier protein] reductase